MSIKKNKKTGAQYSFDSGLLLQKMITQTTYNDIDDSVVSTQLFNKLNEGLLVS